MKNQLTEEQLEAKIAKLDAKYLASTGREAYRLGEQLRPLRKELQTRFPCMGDFDENGDTI